MKNNINDIFKFRLPDDINDYHYREYHHYIKMCNDEGELIEYNENDPMLSSHYYNTDAFQSVFEGLCFEEYPKEEGREIMLAFECLLKKKFRCLSNTYETFMKLKEMGFYVFKSHTTETDSRRYAIVRNGKLTDEIKE